MKSMLVLKGLFSFYVYVFCLQNAWYPVRPEESVRSLATEVTDGCELSYGCEEMNAGPLEEKAVPVTA